MKKLFFFTIIILLTLSCNKEETQEKISQEDIKQPSNDQKSTAYNPKGQFNVNGKREGIWAFYYESGEIKKEGYYKDGKKDGKWKNYYKNGKIKYIEEYVDNLENGKWLSFDQDEKMIAKGFYKDGKKDGKWITRFYNNGQVHIEEFFKEGINIGSTNVYHQDGKLLESTFYTNYNYYDTFNPHDELDKMAKLAESFGIYDHNVDAYHRAIDAGDRNDIDSFIKALYDIEATLNFDY